MKKMSKPKKILPKLLLGVAGAVLLLVLIGAIYVGAVAERELDLSLFKGLETSTVTKFYYMDEGEWREWEDARLYGEKNIEYVPLSKIPNHLKNALIAIEDKRFYSHGGVDWYRTVAAGINYIFRFDERFGASTITQQLIKNVTGEDEISIERKIREIVWAMRLEDEMSKDEILEYYLNVINLSDSCYGVQSAAQRYFSKDACELSLLECACIAAITNNPSYYNPIRMPENNKLRRDLILQQMLEQGLISQSEFDECYGKDVELCPNDSYIEQRTNSWYIDMVIEDVTHDLAESRGCSRAAASRLVWGGGLEIYIQIDRGVQDAMEEYYENTANFVSGEGAVSINNMGLNRMGMNLEGGKDYNGYFYAKSSAPVKVYLAFESKDGSVRYAETDLTVSGDYKKYSFSLTPNRSDDTGRFVIELRSAGTLDVGYVFLEPGEWGLYKGLHVRRDVGELYEKQGISVLRFGGCMANAADWKWKNMTGAPETRKIYKGWWYEYSSYGFGIIEFLDLCEALGVEMIPDFSSFESAADMADFVEFALGTDPDNEWVKLRKEMGREEPYNLKYIQIGNEDKVDVSFAMRFNRIANAIWAIDSSLTLIVGDFEYKDIISDPMHVTGATSGITSLAGQKRILENALEQKGRVLFDIHFWSESGADPMRFFPTAISFYDALKSLVPDADMELCVLELNANNHDLERALCNAIAISNAERLSNIIQIMCSANALQVDKQNDNGWNQGLIFMDNSGAWYQAPAYVDRLFYDCYLPYLAAFTASENVNNVKFDLTVMTSEDGKSVSVKIVNRTGEAAGIGIEIPGFENATMRVVTMKGALKAKNTTVKKDAIKPDEAIVTENALTSGVALVTVAGYSVTTVVFTLD